MDLVRLTVELLRPAPLRPLGVTSEIGRPGRRVQLVTATIRDGDTAIARATGLRIRTADVPVPAPADEPPPGPETGRAPDFDERWTSGYVTRAVDVRFTTGSFVEPGPGTAWLRLRYPVVAGETPGPMQRVAAAADFGNGIGNELSFNTHVFINPDLSIYLHRNPVDEWVCLQSITFLNDRGTAVAESALFDRRGRIGRSAQALLIDERR